MGGQVGWPAGENLKFYTDQNIQFFNVVIKLLC